MERTRRAGGGWAMAGMVAAAVVIVFLAGCSAGGNAPDEPAESDLISTPSASEPVVEVTTVQESEAVPFAATSVDDPGRDAGTSAVTTPGQNGVRTKTYRVTTTDGVETGRELVSDEVTTPPVDQVTSVGSRQPAPPPPSGNGCDPNYSGCVPIASDVDCAGGSGNGPAYVRGPVQVIGTDIYDLDRDGDGTACE